MEQEPPPTPTFADRLTRIIRGLMSSADDKQRAIGWPLAVAVSLYLQRTRNRILAVMAHLAAGTLRPIRQRPIRQRPAGAEPVPRRPPVIRPPYTVENPPPPLPRGFACLVPLMSHHAGPLRIELMTLLAGPEMQAALAAAPRLGRILRPLLHRLGLKPPPGLLPPPSPRRPRAKTARPKKPAPSKREASAGDGWHGKKARGLRPQDSWMPHHPVQVRARLVGYRTRAAKKPP